MFSENTKELFYSTVSFVVDTAKICLASLFAVFVPQRCPQRVDQVCTLEDNLTDLTPFNQAVVISNVVAFLCFVGMYSIEFHREKVMIQSFDVDQQLSTDHLKTNERYHQEFGELFVRFHYWNRIYFWLTVSALIMNLINIAMSVTLIWFFYYLDYRSVTVLLTNVLLSMDRLRNAYNIAQSSRDSDVPISAYMSHPVIFNQIDYSLRISRIRFPPSKIKLIAEQRCKITT